MPEAEATISATDTSTSDATKAATATPPAEAKTTETQAEPMIPKSRLDEVLSKLKAYESDAAKAKKAAEEADTARLAEQGKYKEIADALQAKLDAAQAEAKRNALRLLQRDVAAKTNLPSALADRLKGETEEEMEADAKSIVAALPKPAAPNINANPGAGGAPAAGALAQEARTAQSTWTRRAF